jgi:hypothetical protein
MLFHVLLVQVFRCLTALGRKVFAQALLGVKCSPLCFSLRTFPKVYYYLVSQKRITETLINDKQSHFISSVWFGGNQRLETIMAFREAAA